MNRIIIIPKVQSSSKLRRYIRRQKVIYLLFSFLCLGVICYFLLFYYQVLYYGYVVEERREGIRNPPLALPLSTVSDYTKKPSSEFSNSLISVNIVESTITSPVPLVGNTEETIACNFPKLDAFDPAVLEFVEEPSEVRCETAFPYLFETDLSSNLIRVADPMDFGFSHCCYVDLSRKEFSEDSIEYSEECLPIIQNITNIPAPHEFISIFCNNATESMNATNSTPEDFVNYQIVDIFGFAPIKPEVEARIASISKTDKDDRKLNVVILGLDAMSHLNFIRTMPLTHKYITTNLSGVAMEGYVKVGDNTFPNLVSVLMGKNLSEIEASCWNSTEAELDDCPFLWKDYAEQGYRTSYGEDTAWMSSFNYAKRGFKNPPTDYYLRPLMIAQSEHIAHWQTSISELCYGPRLAVSVLLDNIEKMATGMPGKYFQFIWSNSLTHDELNLAMLADEPVLSTLTFLEEGGYLNQTIFILMSDHGMRWGDIRSTHQGMVEERMPLLYLIFPPWFQKSYPRAMANLRRNGMKLTTPFDLHETLRDLTSPHDTILDGRIEVRSNTLQMSRGISLFLPISPHRTCPEAEISEHWCICHTTQSLAVNSTLAREAAVNVVLVVNSMLERFEQCAQLELAQIKSAQMLVLQPDIEYLDFSNTTQTETVVVTLETLPGHAVFETTVIHSLDLSDDLEWIVGPISRTNKYGNQSYCVPDYELKMYCYC